MSQEKKPTKTGRLALLISLLALIMSLYAVYKIGAIQSSRPEVPAWKTELQQQIQEVRKLADKRIQDLGMQIDLLEAKAGLLKARMYLAVEKNTEKATAEVEKSKTWLKKAYQNARGDMQKTIGMMEEDLSKAKEMVSEQSDRAIKEIEALGGRIENLVRQKDKKETEEAVEKNTK